MSDTFSITETDWQGVDDKPTARSENLVKSGGVYLEINGETLDENDITPTSGYYLTNGVKEASGNWRNYIIPNNGFNHVDATLYGNYAASAGAINFYSSSSVFDATTLILSEPITTKDQSSKKYSTDVPNNTITIIISNRSQYGSATFAITKYRIKQNLNILSSKTDVLSDKISRIEYPLFNKIFQRLNGDGTITSNTNYCATDYIPVSEGDIVNYSGFMSSGNACISGYLQASEQGFIQVLLMGNAAFQTKEIIIPDGVKYIRSSGMYQSSGAVSDPYISVKRSNVSEYTINSRKEAQYRTSFSGKKIAVIGDSISTGFPLNPYYEIRPTDVGSEIESWITYYDVYTGSQTPTNKTVGGVLLTESMIGTKQNFTPTAEDVGKTLGGGPSYYGYANYTWINKVGEKLGAKIANASWSGASMCAGQQEANMIASYAWHDCTIGRCRVREDDGTFSNPDIVIIYRGVNDFSKSQGVLGAAMLDTDYDIDSLGYPVQIPMTMENMAFVVHTILLLRKYVRLFLMQ